MPRVSPGYLEERRRTILAAALECFSSSGFHETTIAHIARAAGVSHGAIYRYFSSKDDIVEASAQRDKAARERRFTEASATGTPLEVLDAVMSGYIARYWGHERIVQARLRAQLYSEAVSNPNTARIVQVNRDDVLGRLGAIVREAQVAGQISPTLDPMAVARVMSALYDGLSVQQALDTELDIATCTPVVSALLRGTFVVGRGEEVTDVDHGRPSAA